MKTNSNEFFFYPKVDNKDVKKKEWKKRSVVAGVVSEDKTTITFGMSQCSFKDLFVKKKGRVLALGRAKSRKPAFSLILEKDEPISAQFLKIAKILTRVSDTKLEDLELA